MAKRAGCARAHRDDAGHERERVADRLPGVPAHALVGEAEGELALVRVDEHAWVGRASVGGWIGGGIGLDTHRIGGRR